MTNMTLSIPDSIYAEMQAFPELKWSEVARRAIVDKLEFLKITDTIANKSKLTQKDVNKFDKMIKTAVFKRLKNENNLR